MTLEEKLALLATSETQTSNWLRFNKRDGEFKVFGREVTQLAIVLKGVAIRYQLGLPSLNIKQGFEFIFEFYANNGTNNEILRYSLRADEVMLVDKFLSTFATANQDILFLKKSFQKDESKNPKALHNLNIITKHGKFPEGVIYSEGAYKDILPFQYSEGICTNVVEVSKSRIEYFCKKVWFAFYGCELSKDFLLENKRYNLENNERAILMHIDEQKPFETVTDSTQPEGDDLPF